MGSIHDYVTDTVGLSTFYDPTAKAAEGAYERDICAVPVIGEELMREGTDLECLACLYFTQPLNHTGRQDQIDIEKELSFPSSPFCPYTGRPAEISE